MELEHINANLLVALDLLLAEESVGRAAERHGVTASAMSHSLRALRDLFDDPLLVKTRRGMRPTPFAATLRRPLRRALRDLRQAVSGGVEFDPATTSRGFIVHSPDFLSTLLLPHITEVIAEHAPRIDIEIRPVERRGSALLLRDAAALAEGEIDLFAAAVLSDIPEINTEPLYQERFVCIVRADHPLASKRKLGLEAYAATPHIVITITDDRSSTWIDEELGRHGLSRHIAVRTRYFMSAPALVAQSDLIATCPHQLARWFARRFPIAILEPPLSLPRYNEFLAWHERYDGDPALQWLRNVFREAAVKATA